MRTTPTKAERWAITFVTTGFIVASAVLHLALGGAFPHAQWKVAAAPSPQILVVDVLLRPTPPPPTPRPSPTPKPTQEQARPSPEPRSQHPQSTAAPERRELAQPAPDATAGIPIDGQPTPPQSPAAPAPSAPADARYVVVSARFIHEVHPDYPRDATEAGEEGTVIVLLTVGPDGVSDARVWVSSGYPSLDRAALQAAKESTYSVPEVNGEPATETYRVIYTFNISS